MIRIAVVDDDAIELQELYDQLIFVSQQTGREFQVDRYSSPEHFLEEYHSQYDLLCLDIDMPERDGMSIAEEIRTRDEEVLIMFVTHMANMAIRGYDVQAVDFVLKPVNRYSLLLKMQRILKAMKQRTSYDVVIPSTEGTQVVPSHELYYIEVSGHYLYYHAKNGVYKQKASLKQVEEEMLRMSFSKCNNCYLVNLKHVNAVNKDDIKVGTEWLRVSRSRKKAFLQELTRYIEGGNC